jgi:hypothetical protein
MIDWNLQSRAHACQACEQPFADQAPYHTLLFDERSGYSRLDVCEGCWQAQYSQGASDRKGFVSHWQGTYEVPPVAPADPIARATAESLLRKLVELNDPQYRAACFILAVMLERKRLLKVKDQQHREGLRIFIYEQPRTGDLFTIPDPNLQLNQLEAVQHDVAHLLEHGLRPPEPPPAPAPETPVEDPTPVAVPSAGIIAESGLPAQPAAQRADS